MKTNDLKKGDRIQLRNGWYGTIMDNLKGNTRLVDVEGTFREIGSVYGHNIAYYVPAARSAFMLPIEHTPQQLKRRDELERINL